MAFRGTDWLILYILFSLRRVSARYNAFRKRGNPIIVKRDKVLDQGAKSLISLRGLTKTFEFGGFQRQVLDAVDVDIAQGEFIVLLGKSGSGKST